MRPDMNPEEQERIRALVADSVKQWWNVVPEGAGIAVLMWDMDDSGKLLYMTNGYDTEDMLRAVRDWVGRMEQLIAAEERARHIQDTGLEP